MSSAEPTTPIRVELSRILIREMADMQVVDLRDVASGRSFPIVIGLPEAYAIERRLKGEEPERPQTHELVDSILRELGATVERIVIPRLDGGTYVASLYLRTADGVVEIDARPSDAIAVGVGHATPIEVAEEVLAESAEERPDVEPPIEAGGNDDDDDE